MVRNRRPEKTLAKNNIRRILKYEESENANRVQLTRNPAGFSPQQFRESFAITPKGTFITSAWYLGRNGEPLDEAFVLGDLTQDHVNTILATPKAQTYRERMNDNFGHCKIFSYFHSQKQDPLDRIFDKADPLYVRK